MRRLLVALLVAAFLAPGFPAQAHATGAHHVTPKTVLLPPLSSNETVLEFEGGPLFEGWVFVLVARTRSVGVTVAAALRTGEARYICRMTASPNSEHLTLVAPSINRWKS